MANKNFSRKLKNLRICSSPAITTINSSSADSPKYRRRNRSELSDSDHSKGTASSPRQDEMKKMEVKIKTLEARKTTSWSRRKTS